MSDMKPEAGAILSIIGGIFILFLAVIMVVFGSMIALDMVHMKGRMSIGMFPFSSFFFPLLVIGAIGMASGIIIIASAFLALSKPDLSGPLGAMVVAFAIISVLSGGGLLIGALLSLIGGVLIIARR